MKWLFFGLIVVHALIHLMGFAKAFELAEIPQLARTIPRGLGIAWLVAAACLAITAMLVALEQRQWWWVGAIAVILSQFVIITAWSDAKYGTIANVVILAGLVYGFASQGPPSLRAEYESSVRERLPAVASAPLVTADDLRGLPDAVRCYLEQSGAVGKPRVRHFKAEWRGRIRESASDPWMEFTAEQVDFVDEPSRFFFMRARRAGLPVDVLHVYRTGTASMRVRLLSLAQLVHARGAELDIADTVTLFNDLALFMPAALLDPAISWEPLDDHVVRATYAKTSQAISAVLTFDESCELTNFVSDDRYAAVPGGREFVRMRWSTPVHDYREFGGRRIASKGEARWHPPEGEFAYMEVELLGVEANGEVP